MYTNYIMVYLIHPNASLIKNEALGAFRIMPLKMYHFINSSSSESKIRDEYDMMCNTQQGIEGRKHVKYLNKCKKQDIHRYNFGITDNEEKSVQCECGTIYKNKEYNEHLESERHLEYKLMKLKWKKTEIENNKKSHAVLKKHKKKIVPN